MKLTTQGLKELIDNHVDIEIYDHYPMEDIISLAENATKNNRKISIKVREKGLEDLKRIAVAANGNLKIILD